MSYTVTVPAGVLWYLDRLAEYLDLPGDRVERRRLSFSSGMEFAGRVVENLMGQRTRLGHYNPREQRFYNRRIFPFDVKEEKKTDQQVKILRTMLSKGLPPQYFLEPDYGFGLDVHGEATLKRHLDYLKQGTPRLTSEDFAQFSIELALISSMFEPAERFTATIDPERDKVKVFKLKDTFYTPEDEIPDFLPENL